MKPTSPLTTLARIAAALAAFSFFGFWVASRRGAFMSLEPQHFVFDTLLFLGLAFYLRLDGFLTARESRQTSAEPVEEVVEVHTGEATTIPAGIAQPAWKNTYVLSAAIIGASLLIAGVLLGDGKKAGVEKVATAPAAAPQAPAAAPQQAPQAQALQAPSAPVTVSVDDDPFLGKKDAPVTIVAFEDFQCPFCARLNQDVVPKLIEQYVKPGKLRYVYRDYPLPFHQFAQKAHEAGECADDQSKFWEMHKEIYANQSALDVPNLKTYAGKIGLNQSKFDQCLDSGKYKDEVAKDYAEGSSYGVSGTPTLYVNGRQVVGAQPLASFTSIIDEELKKLGK